MKSYILATNKVWNIKAFMSWRSKLDGDWEICVSPHDLVFASKSIKPRFVFFPHWSHIVPRDFLEVHECVCFHMTDVPYGRGGSPLQNLIVRGHKETVLTALRMTSELDAGPVYLKRPLRLAGTAHDIFQRAADLGMEMIQEIVQKEPEPVPQLGEPVLFKRRKPEQSKLPTDGDLYTLFDHIRMLDAPTYPLAFVEHGDFMLDFSQAILKDDEITARVSIRKK